MQQQFIDAAILFLAKFRLSSSLVYLRVAHAAFRTDTAKMEVAG